MKKSLLTLLVVPLLLAGCAGSKKPGERGEDVLTAEQREKLLAEEMDNFTVEDKKLIDLKIDRTVYTHSYPASAPFYIFDKDTTGTEANEWKIYSSIGGELATVTKPEGSTTTQAFTQVSTAYSTWFNGSLRGLNYYATFEKDEEVINYNVLIDMFGNVIWKSNKPYFEERVYQPYTSTETDPVTGEKIYIVTIMAKDTVNNTYSVTSVAYNENFRSLKPYQTSYNSSSYPVYSFTHKDVEYKVGDAGNGEYYVSHTNKDNEVEYKYFEVPQGANVRSFLGEYLVYQRTNEVNVHEEEVYTYTAYDGTDHITKAYKLITERLNLVDLEKEEIEEFPYLIEKTDYSIFLNEEALPTDPIAIPQYTVANLRPVVNKHLSREVKRYVIDAGLVLHDELTTLTDDVEKFGESHYYDHNNERILDANFNTVKGLERYNIDTLYPKCAVVNEDGRYGVIDEEGNVIVKVTYPTISENNAANIIVFSRGSGDNTEVLYFNPYTLKAENRVLDENKTYYQQDDNPRFYLERGTLNEETSEYSDNIFYFLGKKVASYKHFNDLTNPTFTEINSTYNKNRLSYNTATFTTDENEFVILTVLSAKSLVK